MQTPDKDLFFTTGSAVRFLKEREVNLTTWKLMALLARGEIPCSLLDNTKNQAAIIRRSDLESWLEARDPEQEAA